MCDQLPMRELADALTDVFVGRLHYYENFPRLGPASSFAEIEGVIKGGISRYRSDPCFNTKVKALVADALHAIRQVHDQEEQRRARNLVVYGTTHPEAAR